MQVALGPIQAESCQDPNLKFLCKLALPRSLPALIDLPIDYTDLINSVSLFKCAKCEQHDSRMPTMCLICGEILCSQVCPDTLIQSNTLNVHWNIIQLGNWRFLSFQSYCCQQVLKKESVGACTYHAYFCGGGTGIFLRIRECRLFLLRGRNKGNWGLPFMWSLYFETL